MFAEPVRYMVVKSKRWWFRRQKFDVIDTCWLGKAVRYLDDPDNPVVCTCKYLDDAHRIARRMNLAEGYTYHPEWGL